MDKTEFYIVQYFSYLTDQEYQWIGSKENLDKWLKDGSLQNGDKIHKVSSTFEVVEKKELELKLKIQ